MTFYENILFRMHGFRDNEVSLQAGYDVTVISPLGRFRRIFVNFNWLKAKERIDFQLAVLVFKCVHEYVPSYLVDELSHPANSQLNENFAWHRHLYCLSIELA